MSGNTCRRQGDVEGSRHSAWIPTSPSLRSASSGWTRGTRRPQSAGASRLTAPSSSSG
jgi:hypothetical protein